MNKIRVMIVDDSAFTRQVLESLLELNPQIEVVASVGSPAEAQAQLAIVKPDVMTLDVEMPQMSGVQFLRRIMKKNPLPVIMVSKFTANGAAVTFAALKAGAVDFITKPESDAASGENALKTMAAELAEKIQAAATANIQRGPASSTRRLSRSDKERSWQTRLIALGGAVGGIDAAEMIIAALPADFPPIVYTQHIPAPFTAPYAQRLDEAAALKVKVAANNEALLAGHVYLAPEQTHLEIKKAGAELLVSAENNEPIGGALPAIDVMMRSVAELVGDKALGAILSGGGVDGVAGLLAMRQAGARCLAQDAATAVISKLSATAQANGAVDAVRPLEEIAPQLETWAAQA